MCYSLRLFEDYDRWYDLARYRVTRIIFDDDYDRYMPIDQLVFRDRISCHGNGTRFTTVISCYHSVCSVV